MDLHSFAFCLNEKLSLKFNSEGYFHEVTWVHFNAVLLFVLALNGCISKWLPTAVSESDTVEGKNNTDQSAAHLALNPCFFL